MMRLDEYYRRELEGSRTCPGVQRSAPCPDSHTPSLGQTGQQKGHDHELPVVPVHIGEKVQLVYDSSTSS